MQREHQSRQTSLLFPVSIYHHQRFYYPPFRPTSAISSRSAIHLRSQLIPFWSDPGHLPLLVATPSKSHCASTFCQRALQLVAQLVLVLPIQAPSLGQPTESQLAHPRHLATRVSNTDFPFYPPPTPDSSLPLGALIHAFYTLQG